MQYSKVPYPLHKVVENPKPIELEQHKPVDVQRPLKYIETVNIPTTVDGKASSSKLNTNVNSVNPQPANDGFQDLTAGYESHKIQKKAWIVFTMFYRAIARTNLKNWSSSTSRLLFDII